MVSREIEINACYLDECYLINGLSRLTVACPQWFIASSNGKYSLEMTSCNPLVFVTLENATLHVYLSLHILLSAVASSVVNRSRLLRNFGVVFMIHIWVEPCRVKKSTIG